jgi:hypothetical protein
VPVDLERLAAYARRVGFRRNVAATIFLIGCLPAAAVLVLRGPSGEAAPLIAALLLFTPAALLLIWTTRDRVAQDAREIVMWLRVIDRASTSAPWLIPHRDLPDVPPDDELPRVRLDDVATELRETISPLVAGGGLSARIFIQRFWYPIQALVVSGIVAIVVLVLLPALPRPA